MDVGINQTRKQRAIAEIDHLCASRTFDGRAHLDDAFALHQDFPWLDDAPRLNIQQACRMEHDWVRLRLRLAHCAYYESEQGQK